MEARSKNDLGRYWPLTSSGVQRRDVIDRPKVLIQQDCIPHYRVPVFRLLTDSPDVQVKIISDHKFKVPFLRIVDGEEYGLRHKKAKTHFLFRRFGITWQPAAIPFLLKERPDVLIGQGAFNSITTWMLCLLARRLGIPVLLWGHGLLQDEHGPKWWFRRALYKMASGHLLQGEHAKELLVKKGFDQDTIYVIYNSLDYDAQQRVIAEITQQDIEEKHDSLGVKQGERLIVFIGRLLSSKRLDLLLEAVAILAHRGRHVHVALVGEGNERTALRNLACTLDMSGYVHFLGETYNEKRLGTIISAADLAVVPSAAGLSVMHALTFGTPVLLHDRKENHGPEWESVQEGITGYYYKCDDVNDMAHKIESALFPEPRKPQMSQLCKDVIAERYNPHRQVATIVAAVRDAVASKGSRTFVP